MVGGGNSAGQAIVQLASLARSVRVVVRGAGLSSTMSRYLVDRIEHARNIEVMTQTEVAAAHGDGRLEAVALRRRGEDGVQRVETTTMFVMIGADPCTEMVEGMLGVDPAGYLVCGKTAACHQGPCRWPLADRDPQLLETVRPGVFAAGGRARPSASPAPWATARWRCASRTRRSPSPEPSAAPSWRARPIPVTTSPARQE